MAGPLELAKVLENRKNTLNKRINYKGNYENYITGGSHALNNQAKLWDTNETANVMATDPAGAWGKDPWTQELNDRYTNPQHNEKAGNQPFNAEHKLKYIHRYTPSTKRGRRVADIFFEPGRHGVFDSPMKLAEFQKLVNKYEGKK